VIMAFYTRDYTQRTGNGRPFRLWFSFTCGSIKSNSHLFNLPVAEPFCKEGVYLMAFETNWAYARVSARMRKCPGNFCDLACMPFESIILTMEKVGDAECI
jgi:hypothetical protein